MKTTSVIMILALIVVALTAGGALATNGMNLMGYGPISSGMGGTSYAFDNGTAAMMNNPATLGIIPNGVLLDVAFGALGPDVTATVITQQGNMAAKSEAEWFYMPALGIFVNKGALGYGFGVFGQGGMGTEYGATSWMSDPSMGQNSALTQGLVNRSEVSVGRALIPLTYRINDQFTIGGSLDFVWAGIDLQMAMSEAQFQDLVNPMLQTIGTASGSLVNAFAQFYEPVGGSGISQLYHAYFDFSNTSAYTGEAKGYGFAGKLGLLYKLNDQLSFGATYHSTTALGDLETSNAGLSMGVNIDPGVLVGNPTGSYEDMNLALTGKIKIKDFQWPAIFGLGMAYKPLEELLLAFDFKYIMWSSVMEDFKMTFTADDSPSNGGFAGLSMDAALYQKWENQPVFALGAAFKATEAITLRGGFNRGTNPVPNEYLNALFPAIVENHVTFGAGWGFRETMRIDASIEVVMEKAATNPGNGTNIPPVESAHSQLNWAIMFSNHF
jgi:long-chain fatty acid transport protein